MKDTTTVEDIKEVETVTDDFMENGVRFLEIERDNGDAYYLHVDDNGYVSITSLNDPREFNDPNYTFATIESTGTKVMLDDDGIHREW